MIDDVFSLAKTLETGFLDVQADAATAIAGLTSDGEVASSPIVVLSLAFHTVVDLLFWYTVMEIFSRICVVKDEKN